MSPSPTRRPEAVNLILRALSKHGVVRSPQAQRFRRPQRRPVRAYRVRASARVISTQDKYLQSTAQALLGCLSSDAPTTMYPTECGQLSSSSDDMRLTAPGEQTDAAPTASVLFNSLWSAPSAPAVS